MQNRKKIVKYTEKNANNNNKRRTTLTRSYDALEYQKRIDDAEETLDELHRSLAKKLHWKNVLCFSTFFEGEKKTQVCR